MRAAQQALVALADQDAAKPAVVDAPSIEAFLAGLRTAWRDGEVRPTAQPKPKQKRGRRRPDPLVAGTAQLRAWFDADPSRTGANCWSGYKLSILAVIPTICCERSSAA